MSCVELFWMEYNMIRIVGVVQEYIFQFGSSRVRKGVIIQLFVSFIKGCRDFIVGKGIKLGFCLFLFMFLVEQVIVQKMGIMIGYFLVKVFY